MKCKHCGAEMSDYHVFCTNCGNPLDMADDPPPRPAPRPAPASAPDPVPAPPQEGGRAAKAEQKTGGGGKLPLCIALAVLATAVLVMAFFLFRRPPAETAPPPQAAAAGSTETPAGQSASAPTAAPEPAPTAAAEPTPTPLPDPGLTLSEIEPEVTRIRAVYNEIMEGIASNRYAVANVNGADAYYENGSLRCVMTERGADGSSYMRWYFYENDALIFSYYEGLDSHRLYFRNDALFRWRFCADSAQPDQAVNHDLENSDAFREWETTVLRDARVFQNR